MSFDCLSIFYIFEQLIMWLDGAYNEHISDMNYYIIVCSLSIDNFVGNKQVLVN